MLNKYENLRRTEEFDQEDDLKSVFRYKEIELER